MEMFVYKAEFTKRQNVHSARVVHSRRRGRDDGRYLHDRMADTIGLPRTGAYFPSRHPTHLIHTGDTTLNDFKIDRSTIGVLNTGSIANLNASVTSLNQSGNAPLGAAIKTPPANLNVIGPQVRRLREQKG